MRYASFLQDLAASGSTAWAVHSEAMARHRRGEDVIILSVGDPDFTTPPPIADAAVDALRSGQTKYSAAGGVAGLRKAIAQTESKRLGLEISPDEVTVTAGAQNALYMTMRCLLDPDDAVILLSPPYVMFEGVVRAAGGTPILAPLDADRGFALDPDAVAAAITPKTRAILLNSPHNPSGAIANRAAVERLAALCVAHDLWLISDEVYADLCFERSFYSPRRAPGVGDRCVVIRSLSKSHAMSGWRIGWAVGPAAFAGHARNLLNNIQYGGSAFLQAGAEAALTGDGADTACMKEAYRRRRDLLVEGLASAPGLRALKPEAGIFALADTSETSWSGESFSWALLNEAGVSVLPGGAFGPVLQDRVRISLCQPDAVLAEACARIVHFLSRHAGQAA
ncbi:MAG: pyridoxal phosphate-dependent aminotransferase [Alphaproteobacteria bacterium]|nr:pyridoxal phosphate-dependent aminotransferase [Alphaproteobacteria bacterium]